MHSYNGDEKLKAQHVALAEHHAAADMLVSGTYGDGKGEQFKGCSVGCFAHDIAPRKSNNLHAVVATHFALPEWLVRYQDTMFESLPACDRNDFHVELAKRIPVGVNLDPLPHLIAIARIDRLLVLQQSALAAEHPKIVHDAIQQTINALIIGKRAHESATGGNVCEIENASAESAAWSAAASAASAAWSAAASAWSAARSAESAAESAAWSAAASAAASAAWSAAASAESAALSAAASAESALSAARSAAWLQERDALFSALDSLK